jgi:hypothetical protein
MMIIEDGNVPISIAFEAKELLMMCDDANWMPDDVKIEDDDSMYS